jgi:phosphodiesterase/alkaline phosphatase D-like protein
VSWLGEEINSSPAALTGQVIAAVVLIGSVALLAHRGTQLRHQVEQAALRNDGVPRDRRGRPVWG